MLIVMAGGGCERCDANSVHTDNHECVARIGEHQPAPDGEALPMTWLKRALRLTVSIRLLSSASNTGCWLALAYLHLACLRFLRSGLWHSNGQHAVLEVMGPKLRKRFSRAWATLISFGLATLFAMAVFVIVFNIMIIVEGGIN